MYCQFNIIRRITTTAKCILVFNAEKGYEVHIIVDGVSSQRVNDRATALHRLSQSGAFLATSEMALFQMMVDTKYPEFKAISAICREQRPEQLPAV